MRFILARYNELPVPLVSSSVVTMGNFDGVHLGHQELLRKAVGRAKELGLPSIALSFYPHPLKVLNPSKAPPMLLPLDEKAKLFESFGLDYFLCIRFTQDFASLKAFAFVKEVLVESLGVKEVFIGGDFRFGRGREGDVRYLKDVGSRFDFFVRVVEPVVVEGQLVSSTRIRRLLIGGDVQGAWKLLGRPYKLIGKVVKGVGRGRKLGFPTANLDPENEVIPKEGVYSVGVELGDKVYPGAMSIGYNPTFNGEKDKKIEVYIIDFCNNLYNKRIGVLLFNRIRDEKKFSSPDLLSQQIKRDVEEARVAWVKYSSEHGGLGF